MNLKRRLSSKSIALARKVSNEHLFVLVENGRLDLFRMFRADTEKEDLLHHRDSHGNSYLHRVLHQCTDEIGFRKVENMFNYLMTTVPELTHVRNNKGETPLSYACKICVHLPVIKLLVERNADAVSIVDNNQNTPLHHLLTLLWTPLNDDQSSKENTKSLNDILSIIQIFIDKGIDVNHVNSLGILAIFNLKLEDTVWRNAIYKLLIENGAKIETPDGNDLIKYILKCENELEEKYDIVKFFLEKIIMKPSWLKYAITTQCSDKDKIIKLLIDGCTTIEENCIRLAIKEKCDFEIIEKLLSKCKNYDINTQDDRGMTLVMHYCYKIEYVKKLTSLGADLKITDNKNKPILYYITKHDDINPDLIKYLIKQGAEITCFLEYNFEHIESISILSYVIDEVAKHSFKDEKWFALYQYILNRPEFKDPLLPNDLEGIFMTAIVDLFYHYTGNNRIKTNFLTMLEMLTRSNPSILNIKYELCTETLYTFNDVPLLLYAVPYIILFKSISSNVNNGNWLELEVFVSKMLALGYNCTSKDCITPLTALFISGAIPCKDMWKKYGKDAFKKLVYKFIELGVDITSLELSKTTTHLENRISNYIYLKNYIVELLVPDVLILAADAEFKNIDKSWFDIFMSYWGAPSFLFFLFHPDFISSLKSREDLPIVNKLFNEYLLKYEINDLDKNMISKILTTIEEFDGYFSDSDDSIDSSDDMYTTTPVTSTLNQLLDNTPEPRSLTYLCKYKIRRMMAATPHGARTLPELVDTLPLPPPIKKLLIS